VDMDEVRASIEAEQAATAWHGGQLPPARTARRPPSVTAGPVAGVRRSGAEAQSVTNCGLFDHPLQPWVCYRAV